MNKSQGCWKCPVLSSLPLPGAELWNSGCGSRLFFMHVSARSSQAPRQTLLNSLPWSRSRSPSSSGHSPAAAGTLLPLDISLASSLGVSSPVQVRGVCPWDVQGQQQEGERAPHISAGWGWLVLGEQSQPDTGL